MNRTNARLPAKHQPRVSSTSKTNNVRTLVVKALVATYLAIVATTILMLALKGFNKACGLTNKDLAMLGTVVLYQSQCLWGAVINHLFPERREKRRAKGKMLTTKATMRSK